MKKVSVIGAGQLGSRHLQGLMKAQTEMEIWVIDQSEDSLCIARERCEEIIPSMVKFVHYSVSVEELPQDLDLVIVATGSKPRAHIVKALLAHSKVRYLVLEKFLFTKLSEYGEIEELLNEQGVTCWVNCPRRMWDAYSEIKSIVNPDKPLIMEHLGEDWGMCCNSVHFIDVWMFLAGDSPISVDLTDVEPRIIESKRPGYIELLGKETFTTVNGDRLTLGSFETYTGSSAVVINNDGNTITVDSAKKEWSVNGEVHTYRQVFQSERTGILADEIFETGNCRLVSYKNSTEYHIPYLKSVLDFVNKLQGTNNDSCPIT